MPGCIAYIQSHVASTHANLAHEYGSVKPLLPIRGERQDFAIKGNGRRKPVVPIIRLSPWAAPLQNSSQFHTAAITLPCEVFPVGSERKLPGGRFLPQLFLPDPHLCQKMAAGCVSGIQREGLLGSGYRLARMPRLQLGLGEEIKRFTIDLATACRQ